MSETDFKVKKAIADYLLLIGEDIGLVGIINNWMEMQSSETVLAYLTSQIEYRKNNP